MTSNHKLFFSSHYTVRSHDDIQIVAAGDQTMLSQALEKGTVDATVVDSAFSQTLKQQPGLPILIELSKTTFRLSATASRLKISNPALAEQGYQDLQRATDRKPYPAVEGLSNVQRLMKLRKLTVADLKTESLSDARLIQELDQTGFIDQLYSSYGVK